MYNFETQRVIKIIKENKAEKVLLQFPEGLKPKAAEIAKQIQDETNAFIMIWGGSCFGACDIPNVKCDLLIQYGHSSFE